MRNGSGYTYIMVGAESRAEYFILPVGRGFAQSVGLKTILAKLLITKLRKSSAFITSTVFDFVLIENVPL